MNSRIIFALRYFVLFLMVLSLVSCRTTPYQQISDGLIVHVKKSGTIAKHCVRLKVVTNNIIHVSSIPGDKFVDEKSLMVIDTLTPKTDFSIIEKGDTIILKTALLNALVLQSTGEVIFTDTAGKVILAEKQGGGKTYEAVTVEKKEYLAVRQQFESQPGEALYGLGANQTSYMNLKGKDADLFQYNTQAVVPFLVSTKNYGILWDNNSRTKFGDIREFEELSGFKLYDEYDKEGALTAVYTDKKDPSKIYTKRSEKEINYQFIPDLKKFPEGFNLGEGAVTWEGAIETDITGLHKFMFTSAGYSKLWIGGKLLFDRWRQCWNPSSNRFDMPMEAGKKYSVKIEWIPDGGESFIALKHLTPLSVEEQNRISFYSEVANQIDYYFIAGQNPDEVISGYRTLTGKAPMMPKWAMGFWQSRERYKTQDEILNTVREFRKRQIPIDNIVLDWQYWPIDKWGDHDFDSTRFPDPNGMMSTLHDSLNTHLMISVWAKYYKGTKNYEEMDKHGWLYKLNIEKNRKDWLGYVSTFYDAFNADARKDFWNQINTKLFSKGIDAWWMDATEPDITSNLPMDERKALMNPTALGPGSKYFNAFSLEQASAVYEGQRKTSPDQRVYILTRSAFAGLQRYAAANWSGDIAARWHDMKAQIPCGLNFCISGIPYWTMDIGGFAVETRYNDAKGNDLDEWRELMTRWFQFGTFAPIFRVHGQYPYREMFNIAPENHPAYRAMLAYDKLRYRLMPYIYSLTGMTWLHDYTIMRALAMDFSNDKNVLNIDDQYLFGPSLLINPVSDYKARSRKVYLPANTGWYDFFTGRHYTGGQTIDAAAPYSNIPVFVKEGAILPVGPEIQFTSQKPADPITLFVFSGEDGEFTLYEDENINYNYEKGAYTLIPFSYHDASKTLVIGTRKGKFTGMTDKRTFNIVFVTPDKPGKLKFDSSPDKLIIYDGNEQQITL
ncbi:MAG: TIM-barrel domain-containing protein [Lentimicrobiaceae bacterium]